MKKTLLAVAVLGATIAAHAEQTAQVVYPQVVYPYAQPLVYAPVAPVRIDENAIKAIAEYQQKAYEHHLAYQRHVQANTPAFLRIPAIPQVPALNSTLMQNAAAEGEELRAKAEADSARRADALQQSLTLPVGDIDQAFADREQELDAALAGIQQRLEERQEALDITAK